MSADVAERLTAASAALDRAEELDARFEGEHWMEGLPYILDLLAAVYASPRGSELERDVSALLVEYFDLDLIDHAAALRRKHGLKD